VGAASSIFAAVDASSRLWDEHGLWADPAQPRTLYRWRRGWWAVVAGLAVSAAALLLPLAALLVAGLLYPVALVAGLASDAANTTTTAVYARVAGFALSPAMLTAIVPRVAAVGAILATAGLVVLGVGAWRSRPRPRAADGAWWRAPGVPFEGRGALRWAAGGFWQFIKGAAAITEPPLPELGRRYAELLAENLGTPGYRELILVAHDLDARRDLVFSLLGEPFRRGFGTPVTRADASRRLAELVDLAGSGAVHVFDALAGALAVPGLTPPHAITFQSNSYWRGETHRLVDRPAAASRVLEEVAAAGVEQVILVSASHELDAPHTLAPARLEPRARAGEVIEAAEAAATRDAVAVHAGGFAALFEVHPPHNPLGPFDLEGGHDPRSDRRFTVRELMNRGYEDAYREFIEPHVGASGDAMRGVLGALSPEP
jgi:hypothetical protein